METTIARPHFINWINLWRDRDIIKVVTGIRRCGKTTLLEIYRSILLKDGVSPSNLISINFENPETPEFKNFRDAYQYIRTLMKGEGKHYVFLDEVQLVPDFERLVDGLFAKKDCDIYITGSNSKFLSGELATFLTGRYVEIQLYPLSFSEYTSVQSKNLSPDAAFQDYMRFGGFPMTALLPQSASIQTDYLSGILNTILYKDIAAKHGIRDLNIFQRLTSFIFDNIGNLLSVNKIAGTFKNDGFAINNKTIDSYLDLLCDAFLIHRARRYDIRGRELLKTNAKYYIADTGLRRLLLADKPSDLGRVLANIVYLELKRRYREVFVGTLGVHEIDFVALENAVPHYYQVALTTREETTLVRELAPLQAIRDNHPKILLTLDRDPPANFNGIKKINVIDFLLDPKALER